MSAAPTHPARPPPPGRCHQPLSGAFIVPPVPHASRSFVLAAARLRALRLDPLVTGSELPFAEQTPKKTRIRPLAPGPRLHRESSYDDVHNDYLRRLQRRLNEVDVAGSVHSFPAVRIVAG
jgi:hypothetical protein